MRSAIALAALLSASMAHAGGGIDFAAMPKGCSWQTWLSDRPAELQTYVGKVKGRYRVAIRDAVTGAAISVIDYDAQGLMVSRKWADGRWERFEPFSCYTVPGKCSYTYRNGAGDRIRIDSEVRAADGGFVSLARPSGGTAYPAERFTLGSYGLTTSTKSKNYASKIIDFTECGPVS